MGYEDKFNKNEDETMDTSDGTVDISTVYLSLSHDYINYNRFYGGVFSLSTIRIDYNKIHVDYEEDKGIQTVHLMTTKEGQQLITYGTDIYLPVVDLMKESGGIIISGYSFWSTIRPTHTYTINQMRRSLKYVNYCSCNEKYWNIVTLKMPRILLSFVGTKI